MNAKALKVLMDQNPNLVKKKCELDISMDLFKDELIAGMNYQLELVLLEIFQTKLNPAFKSFKHLFKQSKGMIIHGPPGTGKTLTARTIINVAGRISDVMIKTISGPQLFDKMYGESEKKIQALFQYAFIDAKEDRDRLQLILIDEIDSLLGERGEGALENRIVG